MLYIFILVVGVAVLAAMMCLSACQTSGTGANNGVMIFAMVVFYYGMMPGIAGAMIFLIGLIAASNFLMGFGLVLLIPLSFVAGAFAGGYAYEKR